MTAVKAMEYRISHKLMHRREGAREAGSLSRLPERLINVVAITVLLFTIGSYLPELLWVLFGAGSIAVIGTK